MQETRDIKKAKTRLKELSKEIAETKFLMGEYQRAFQRKIKEQKDLTDKLESMKGNLKVTEHAMLRYFERVLGYDLDLISSDIINQVGQSQSLLGDGNYPCEINGLTFHSVIKGDNVVTITKD